jgi:hypothetical protein
MITVNRIPVLPGSKISMSLVGTWVGTFRLSSLTIPSGQVTIDDGAGSQLIGQVIPPGGMIGPQASIRVVGGAGGLAKEQASSPYRLATFATVFAAILAAAGERQHTAIYPTTLAKTLQSWSTQRASAGTNLSTLCQHFGFEWRVKPDGGVWAGPPSEGVNTPGEALIEDGEPSVGRFKVAPEGLWLLPGMTQSRGRVARVIYDVQDTLRATYWIDQ